MSWQPSGTPATDPFSDDYAGNGDPGLYRRLNPEGDDTPDQRDLHELVTQLRTGDFSTEMRYPFVGFSRQYVLLDDDSNPVALVEIINSNYGFVIRDIIQTADGAYSVTNTIGHVLPIFPIEPTPDDAL